MKPDDEFNKQFDLEQTEFRRSEAREPFWGFGAPILVYGLIMVALSLPISAAATWLVTGQFPYWLRPFLE